MGNFMWRSIYKSGAIDDYLTPHYDVLHTLGEQYLIKDIERVSGTERGGGMIVYHGSAVEIAKPWD